MTDLSKLIERLKAATAPDRNADAMLYHWSLNGIGSGNYGDAPRYTASVDASLALVERLLPGWLYRLDQYADGYLCNLAHWNAEECIFLDDVYGKGVAAPLAILLAALTALQSKDETNVEGV